MEAIVHLDHPAAMPSQSQMAYAQRSTSLHSRSGQGGGDVYKGGPGSSQGGQGSRHNPAAYAAAAAAASYTNMRYMPYALPPPPQPPPPPPPSSYREIPYTSSRSSSVVAERSQSMDYVRNEPLTAQVRPRISLLPQTPEYHLSSAPRNRHHQNDGYRDSLAVPTQGGGPVMDQPIKKIRLGEPKQDEGPTPATYNPQVEAISPTLPSEVLQEDANFRSTKDDLLHGIAKVDREITKTELQISKLRKIQQELEEAAKKPVIKKEEEEIPQPKHQSPAQQIYAENRKKAQEAHALLDNLGPKIDLPLYNQPSDTAIYHENKRKHIAFKMKLLEHLKKKHAERENREKVMSATYSRLVQEWLRKVEKVENSQKRKTKEAKNREFFEKVFPKLRKQREDRERFNRVGARIKSEADLEEIMDGLQEQEMEEKKMRSYAVVPPLLLDARQRSVYYVNNNGRVDDFASDYKERQLLNVWTQSEKEIFKEKFLQHPKNFGVIASYLDRKNVCDCVQYYYLSKKTENYKRLLRKSRQRTRSRNPHGKVNSGGVSGQGTSIDILTSGTGVTTRLQREQLQKQEAPPPATSAEVSANDCDNTSSYVMESTPQGDSSMLLTSHSTGSSDVKLENKKKDRRKEEKKKKEEDLAETTDEEQFDQSGECATGVTQACAVCKTESVCWRALPRSQAGQYGLKEDQVPADARVCNLCRCKAVRSRYTNCPLPSCPNAKGHRVKRLRPMPCKWLELPSSLRDPIAAEFQIDGSVTKCCSACFNRIMRRIGVAMDGNGGGGGTSAATVTTIATTTATGGGGSGSGGGTGSGGVVVGVGEGARVGSGSGVTPGSTGSGTVVQTNSGGGGGEEGQALSPSQSSQMLRWTDEEIEALKKGIRLHGTRWADVSQVVGPTKSQHQCKNFFFNYRKKLGLDQLLQEFNKTHFGEERKPALTDEEESGSSTSSCDEMGPGGGDSDTASAASPSQNTEEKLDGNSERVTSGGTTQVYQENVEMSRQGREAEVAERVEDPSPQTKMPTAMPSATLQANKEDYDSSATETADEGQGGGETETPSGRNPSSPKPPCDPSSPLTVKDLMLGVIEMQFKKDQGQTSSGSSVPGGPPTISSILKSDHSVTYPQRDKSSRPTDVNNSLATLSVVSSHHSHQSPQELPKEGLVVVQVPQAMREPREPEPVTLDLSIKKPRNDNNIAQVAKALPQHQLPSQQAHLFRSSQPPNEQQAFYQQVVAPSMPPKLSPKLSPGILTSGSSSGSKTQCGSIIHGTPVSSPNIYNQSRYDQSAATLIRQVTPPHKEPGSITQGTPVHQRSSIYPGPSAEYYNKRVPTSSFYPPRPPAYSVEQRQIIMNDYITSQQMHGPGASSSSRNSVRAEKLYYQPGRQGVIQRHNTKPPSPHYPPPPGHEAFSSLVDVAVRQPSLPVPPPPITITMPEHKSIPTEEKRHLHEGLGERFNRESPHERFANREQERYARENHKVHVQQPQPRDNHHQQQIRDQQLRDQQIRDQMRDHQMQHMRENQQLQHQREREREMHQQHQLQQMQLQREHHVQQKLRENHLQQLQQRDMEQRSGRHQIPPFQQRLMHDPHHPLDQRLIVSGFPREQQSAPPSQPPSSRSHSNQDQSVEGSSARGRSGEGSTLTAASLIDAIITHQINQSSDGNGTNVSASSCPTQQTQPTRPGDRLFQSFHREGPESNGKLSPMKPGLSPDTKHGMQIQQSQQQSQHSLGGEHMDMYGGSQSQSSRPASYQSFDHQTWKLRRALQHKEVEQPQAREKSEERNIVRFYTDPPVPLSPLDYVKNRIAEVMRTSEEEGSATKSSGSPSASDMVIDEGDSPACQPSAAAFIAPSHTYTYPFSALTLNPGAAGVPISSQSVVKSGEPIPEPAPLLSSQYDPLSDED